MEDDTRISNPVGVSIATAFGVWAGVVLWAANNVVDAVEKNGGRIDSHIAQGAHSQADTRIRANRRDIEKMREELANHDDWGKGDHSYFKEEISRLKIEIERLKK